MRDHEFPIAMDDINLAFEDYVDWTGVDFLETAQPATAVADLECTNCARPENTRYDRTTFRAALIATVLEADAEKKTQAFYEWLNQRRLERGVQVS